MSIDGCGGDIVVGEPTAFLRKTRGALLAPRSRMDYVTPADTINEARALATRKAGLSIAQMLLRGALAGGILAYATSLVLVINAQGLPPIDAAICFPVGFV